MIADIIVLTVIALCLGGIVHHNVSNRKNGKSSGCGCDCSHCSSGSCNTK